MSGPPRPALPSPARCRSLGRVVDAWGEEHRRDLPWRATRDPWAVLVSEVMLQQTQVARVVGPWTGFLRRFPNPVACASASATEVVRAWAGLGYNRRALRLRQAAIAVVDRHGGRIPADHRALLDLPGVGRYTARAVLAFAFGHDVAVVDTNVGRVLARAAAGRPLGPAEAQAVADAALTRGRGWEHNQAMLDLGALHCTSRPACGGCPLRRSCRWARAGYPEPDPARGSAATARPQRPFAGSDRQGRGRLVDALRAGPVPPGALAVVAGWPDDPGRAALVADGLVRDGFARRDRRGGLVPA